MSKEIDWNIEEGWHEFQIESVVNGITAVSISPDGLEVHIYGIVPFCLYEQILSKMKELQDVGK